MHDQLFEQPSAVARYRSGPYAESREQFLRQAQADGYPPATLAQMAWALLIVAEAVHRAGGRITSKQLRSVLRKTRFKSTARPPSANTIKLLLQPGERWLRSFAPFPGPRPWQRRASGLQAARIPAIRADEGPRREHQRAGDVRHKKGR
jgi:hypothetical protein